MSSLSTNHWSQLFICGFAGSCSGELVTQPIDLIKTRLHLAGELGSLRPVGYKDGIIGWLQALRVVIKDEGISELYRGLQPALLRQATYGSLRIGLYEPTKNLLQTITGIQSTSFSLKLFSGMLCGGLSSGLCCPTDVAKVRMQVDGKSRRYSGVFNALYTIYKVEGFKGLYSGVIPTMQRAAIVTAVELSTYDELKSILVHTFSYSPTSSTTHLAASISAGFFSAAASSPADVIKSRMMNQAVDSSSGRGLVYSSSIDCFKKSIHAEGFFALWKGFWPAFARSGPHCIVNFFVVEQMRQYFQSLETISK